MLNPKDFCPTNLNEAIQLLTGSLSSQEKDFIHEFGAESTHHSVGRAIRNAWLWNPDHPLHKFFTVTYGLGHADDMSSVILSGVTAAVLATPYDPDAIAEEYKVFWRNQGIDPLTQKEIVA